MRPPAPRCFGSKKEPAPVTSLTATEVAKIAKGLGHPARVAILEQFRTGESRMVQDIVAESDLAPSTVSEHLRLLRDAGLLTARRDGPRMWYCVQRALIRTFADSIAELAAEPSEPCQSTTVSGMGPKALTGFVESRNHLLNRS